jgi:hypothetical protein
MNIHRVFAVACIVGLSLAAGEATAKKPAPSTDNGNPSNSGYPPGRPWDAVAADFRTAFAKIDSVKHDTVLILQRLDGIEEDLATLKNTLTIQVSVVPNANRTAGTDVPQLLNVLVSQNGAGVTGLTPAAFDFSSAFGAGGASYCGNASCTVAGPGGVYQLRLDTPTVWGAGQYAGSLTVSMDEGRKLAQGTTIVAFDVPAAPAP